MPNKPDPKSIEWDESPQGIEWDAPIPKQKFVGGQQVPTQPPSFLEEATSSYLPSAGRQIKNLWGVVSKPGETAQGLKILDQAIREKVFVPGEQPSEKALEFIVRDYVNAYGGLDRIEHTLRTDPARATVDFGTVVSGIGGILKLAKIGGQASQLANILIKTGQFGDPVSLAIQGGVLPVKAGAKILKPIVGGITGKGATSVERAYKATKGFKAGIEGQVGSKQLVKEGRTALDTLETNMSNDYLQAISTIPMGQPMDIRPVRQTLYDEMKRFHIQLDPNTGAIIRADFDKAEWANIKNNVIDYILDYGSQPTDLTVEGFDSLKKYLSSFYSPNKSSRAFVERLTQKVRNEIGMKYPEYAALSEKYHNAIENITDIKQGLSLGDRTSVDTSFKKLVSSVKDNQEFRLSLIKALDQTGGNELLDKIAGYNMKDWLPGSIIGREVAVGGIGMALFKSATILPTIGMSSPRLVGEFLYYLGKGVQTYRKLNYPVRFPPRAAGYQVGRISPMMTE